MENDILPVDRDSAEFREGRRRLKDLMGRAKAEARKKENELQPHTILAMSIMEVLEEKNFDALVVYQDGPGRWYGDLLLKGMPVGMPNALGTHESTPRESRSAALNEAYAILVAALIGINEKRRGARDTKAQDRRVFELNGISFSLPGVAVDEAARKVKAMNAPEEIGVSVAMAMIRESVAAMAGEGAFDRASYDGASEDLKSTLLTGMGILLVYGEFRLEL